MQRHRLHATYHALSYQLIKPNEFMVAVKPKNEG